MNQPSPSTRPVFGQSARAVMTPANMNPAAATAPAKPSIDFRSRIRKGQPKKPPRIFLYGVEKIGKSTAGLALPDRIYLGSEEGLVGPQFADEQSYHPETWEGAMGFLDWLAAEEHEFKSLIVDTVDWFESKLYAFLIARDKVNEKNQPLNSIEDYGWGKGYTLATDEFKRFTMKLDRLRDKGMVILLLAHSEVRTFKNPTGEDYDRHEPKCYKKIGGLLKEWSDVVLFAEFQVFTLEKTNKKATKTKAIGGEMRVVHTTKSAGWDAGNRYGLPDLMEFDMATIMEAIENGNGAGGESSDTIVNEIRSMAAELPEEKQTKIEEAIAQAGADAAALARVLNKTRATITKFQSEQETTHV